MSDRPTSTGSFTRQIAFRFAALVTVTTALVLAAGGWLLEHEGTRNLETLHTLEFEELRELVGPADRLSATQVVERIRRDTEADAAVYFFQIHDSGGRILFRSANLGETMLPDLTDADEHWTASLPGLGEVRISEFRLGTWYLQIASPLEPVRRLLQEYLKISGLLLAGVALTSVGLGYGFARLTLRPIRSIRETALRIRGDNLGERIPVPAGRDEWAALVELLNRMFDRLETAFKQVRGFSAVASHELKTPLSLIRLNAEKLRPQVAAHPESAAALGDLLEEVSRLHRLIESLLFLAKADSGAMAIELTAVDTGRLLEEFAEDARFLAEDRGVRFELTARLAGVRQGEPSLLRQLLLNLLANALAVSPRGACIRVSATPEGAGWRLALVDEGPGLPESERERVFEPFVRYLQSPPGEQPGGTGLGLAICRSIVSLHGGRIRAVSGPGGRGLSLEATFPS
jgi:signal transduction histidine kinase